jgi:hypothetical protein
MESGMDAMDALRDEEELERIRGERLAQIKTSGGHALMVTGCALGEAAAKPDEVVRSARSPHP